MKRLPTIPSRARYEQGLVTDFLLNLLLSVMNLMKIRSCSLIIVSIVNYSYFYSCWDFEMFFLVNRKEKNPHTPLSIIA